MDDQRFVTKLTNPLGGVRWQPTLPNGERAWVRKVRVHPWEIEWRAGCGFTPITVRGPRVYRSRARAARVAKRRWVKLTENQWEERPTRTT